MELAQIKKGAQVRINTEQRYGHVWRIVDVELGSRGLLLTLEREEGGQTYREQELATLCVAA